MYILPNMSGSKGNQTLKFGQLIESNKEQMVRFLIALDLDMQ